MPPLPPPPLPFLGIFHAFSLARSTTDSARPVRLAPGWTNANLTVQIGRQIDDCRPI